MSEISRSRVIEHVSSWEGVTSDFGSGPFNEKMTFFHLGNREIGHLHGAQVAHIPFPRAVRDELFAAGRARQHSAGFRSHVEVEIETDADADKAIAILRMSYDRARAGTRRKATP